MGSVADYDLDPCMRTATTQILTSARRANAKPHRGSDESVAADPPPALTDAGLAPTAGSATLTGAGASDADALGTTPTGDGVTDGVTTATAAGAGAAAPPPPPPDGIAVNALVTVTATPDVVISAVGTPEMTGVDQV